MPEGDAIFKDARRLRPLLVGQPVTAITCRWPGIVDGLTGRGVTAITTHGKNLLLHFEGTTVLRVHRQMTGFWSSFGDKESDPRLSITTALGSVTLYDAPTVERLDARSLADHPVLSQLGPDVLAADFDADEAVARCPGAMPIGLALLDQTIAAGLGNIYRAETLFFERTNPWTPVQELKDPARIWARGRTLITQNLEHGGIGIRTRSGTPEVWIYGRARKPCLRCNRRIRVDSLGGIGRAGREQLVRKAYWCPICQPG